MKEKTYSILILVTLFAVMILCSLTAKAQTVTVLGGYSANEVKNLINASTINTYTADVEVNILKKESDWQFGPVFRFKQANDVEVIPESVIYPDGIYRNVRTYFGGAKLARKVGAFRIGGAFRLGLEKPHESLSYVRVRDYNGFVDLYVNHLALRLFSAGIEATGAFNSNRRTYYGAGVGFTF